VVIQKRLAQRDGGREAGFLITELGTDPSMRERAQLACDWGVKRASRAERQAIEAKETRTNR